MNDQCLEKICGIVAAAAIVTAYGLGAAPVTGLLDIITNAGSLALAMHKPRRRECRRILNRVIRNVRRNVADAARHHDDGPAGVRSADVAAALKDIEAVIDRCLPEAGDLIGVNLDGERLADMLLHRAEACNPVFGNRSANPAAPVLFRTIVTNTYRHMQADPEYLATLRSAIDEALLVRTDRIDRAIASVLQELQMLPSRTAEVINRRPMPTAGSAPRVPAIGGGGYLLKCPANLEEYDQAAELARTFFGDDLIDPAADRDAFVHNPFTMVVLLDEQGAVVGYVDIYHLPGDEFDRLIIDDAGTVDIDPGRLLPYEQARSVRRAYIASIILDESRRRPGSMDSARCAAALVYGMMGFLLKHQFHCTMTLQIFAIGTTTEGEALLRHLDFSYERMVNMVSGERKKLFSRTVTRPELLELFDAFATEHRLDKPNFGSPVPFVRLEIGDAPTAVA